MELVDSPFGTSWAIGAPGTGKTTYQLHQVEQDHLETGYPIIYLDSTPGAIARTANYANLELPETTDDLRKVIRTVWQEGRSIVFQPDKIDSVEKLCLAILAGKKVHLLIDESAHWISSRRGLGSPILRVLRSWRHIESSIRITTQHFSGDVPQEALSCEPTLLVFRNCAPRALDRLENEYGLARKTLLSLPNGKFIKIST